MSLPRTPSADAKTVNDSPNIGASPTLQSHPPPKIPPEPPDRKSPLPTAPPLDRTKSDLDPNSFLPQSFFDIIGSGTKKRAYSLAKLKEILDQVKINCKENHILPLPAVFASEVAHYFPLDPITHQTLLDHIKENPLQIFSFSKDKLCADKKMKEDSFIFWADQLWYRKHQLSVPLFEIATKYMQLPTTEVDLLFNKFTKDLRNFPQTFLTYREKSFRINRASVNKLMDKINQDATEIDLPEYLSSFFYFLYNFLQTNDDHFDEKHCTDIFMQLSRQFKTYFELDDHTWREIFVTAQFSDSFKFITQNHLFSSFAKVISHPYQELKLTLLRDLSNIKQHSFNYNFFISKENDFSNDTAIFDEDQQKMLPPLIQELIFSEDQLSLGSGKQVRFKPAPLIHEVRSLHISDNPPLGATASDFSKGEVNYSSTPTGNVQSQTQPGQFTVSTQPKSRRGSSSAGGGGGAVEVSREMEGGAPIIQTLAWVFQTVLDALERP